MTRTAAVLAVLLACSTASARQILGEHIPEAVEIEGLTLRLNGAGTRRADVARTGRYLDYDPGGFYDVYVAALYVGAPSSDPATLLAADAPWLMRVIYRLPVDRLSVIATFRNQFARDSKETAKQLSSRFDRLAPAIPDLGSGQVMLFLYQPGVGLTAGVEAHTKMTVEGKDLADAVLRSWLGPRRATVEGKELADAVLRSWIGPHPFDADLEKALLAPARKPEKT